MQLSQNRFFKHKFYPDNVVKSTMRPGEGSTSPDNFHHLYIDLISGESIKGMDGSHTFMLSTARHQDDWAEKLELWMKENQYEDFNPHRMSHQESAEFIKLCRHDMETCQRLGHAIIHRLGDMTPTPNIRIWNSNDEAMVLEWFYDNCVVQT